MGTEDHDAALQAAREKYDALIVEIGDDPGISDTQWEEVVALADGVVKKLGDSKEGWEKGLKVATLARDLFKDPLGLLTKVAPILGL